MICYHCQKVKECSTFRTLCTMSKDFSINDCKDYDLADEYKYRKIANDDNLMRLLYDYYTDQMKVDVPDEVIKQAITTTMLDL